MINGTNGASFHPIITKDETLYMFSSDLCRCVKSFTEDSEKLGNNVAWQAANNVVTVAENHQNLFSLHYLGLNFGLVSVNILEKKGQCHKHV